MDEGEGDECQVDDVEFVVAGEDTPVSFEPAEEPFDLVTFFVSFAVVLPGFVPVAFGRDDGGVSEVGSEFESLVAFVGSVGYQEQL